MKAFKIKRGGEVYFRVELPQNACPDGRRRSVTGKNRAETLARAQEEVDRARLGLDRAASGMTVDEFFAEFLTYYEKDGHVAPSTMDDYRYHADSNIIPVLGKLKLTEIEPRTVDLFMKGLLERDLSQRTCNYALAVLRRALQFAVDWKYIASNPASARTRAAKRRSAGTQLSKIRFLTREESLVLIDAVRGHRFEALYILAMTTGMRQGEMLGLQWPDLDLENGKLTIFRALHRIKRRRSRAANAGNRYVLRQPKTAGSRRTIEIPDVTVQALQRHRLLQNDLRAAAGANWQEQRFVFSTKVGTPLDTSNILHDFQRLLKRAGLSKMRFYDLRHTHASLLIAAGVHPKKIAERLGHASIKLTMDLYGHLFEGSDRESASRMQELFGSGHSSTARSVGDGKVTVMPAAKRHIA